MVNGTTKPESTEVHSLSGLIFTIDTTGLKVYGEGERKVKKHGTDGKHRVWRKLHIAFDTDTHEIIAAELSLSNVALCRCCQINSNKHAERLLRYQVMDLMTPRTVTNLSVES